jgi:polysaccharide biosynthesis protein PslH
VRLLYVTAEVPWPLTSGYLRHFHILRGLARRHEITHLSLTRRAAVPEQALLALERYVQRLEIFDAGDRSGRSAVRSLGVRRAATRLRRAVGAELATGRYDAVLVSGKDTFPALGAVGKTPLVLDVCDAASMRLAGELDVTPRGRRWALLRLRLAEMRHIERRLVARTPHLLFASERDRQATGARGGAIVPNGVDLEFWSRRAPAATEPWIAFSGAMSYRPNDDAARRLVRDVLPLVAEAVADVRVLVAGRDPLPGLRTAAETTEGVTLTGTVDDLRPHLERAAVYCAPLRFAAGIQNKLLEALALELPVVTTPVAAAGLRVGGRVPPVIVADDDRGLARAVVGLLNDPAQRAHLAAAGREYVALHFSWDSAVDRVDAALERAVSRSAPRSASPVLVAGRRA